MHSYFRVACFLSVELGGSDAEPGCGCARVQAAVPHSDDEGGVGDGQGAGEVDGVRPPQGVEAGELACVPLDDGGELDRAGGRPVLLPRGLGRVKVLLIEVMVAGGRGERSTDFGIGQPTRDSGVAAVPQLRCEAAAGLLDQQLHQGA